MLRRAQSGKLTFGEFLELVQEDQKADLIDGVIFMASPESTEHNDLLRWLTLVLGAYVDERRLGRLTINKVAYRLTEKTAPEPDLGFVLTHGMDRIKSGYVEGAPDLAVEIVSPESVNRDYEDKRLRYEAAGVREYWIIDPAERAATFFVRGPEGFVEEFPRESIFHSRVLAGLELDVRWLWQAPLPPTRPIVERLLTKDSR